MSKYEQQLNATETFSVESVLVEGEKVLWQAKPKKSAFVINKVLLLMPFALVWLAFDSAFIVSAARSSGFGAMSFFIIPFFALHLMPVWIWLYNVVTASRKWKNTEYYVTNRRVIIQSGFVGIDFQTIFFKDLKNVELNVGVIDKLLGVGDIYFDLGDGKNGKTRSAFLDIEDPYAIYPKIQKTVLDIQTDIEYPNNLRPPENDGYKTEYNGKI